MHRPKVSIVTPIHNDRDATARYLEALAKIDYPNLELVIVDDGSDDGSAEMVAERCPSAVVLHGDGSLWWAKATDIGAREAFARGAAFVFTCNNDALIAPETIASSVACALEAGKALVGAVVRYQGEPERIWFSGARLDRRTGDIEHDTDLPEEPKPTQMLTGMGMLIPQEAFTQLDGFDSESFPHYLADCDFSLRAAERGYRLLVAPLSNVYNDVSSAWSVREYQRGRLRLIPLMLFSMRSAYWIKGRVRFYRRHWRAGWVPAIMRLYRTWFMTYALPLVGRKLTGAGRKRGR